MDQDGAAGRCFSFINGEAHKGEANAGAKAVVCDLHLCHSYYRQRPFASPSCICILKWKYIHLNFKSAGMGLSMDFGKFVPIFYLFQMC